MERCVIVDYGFLLPQPPLLILKRQLKRVPSKPQSHQYPRKVREENAKLTESSDSRESRWHDR
jgi:hypothetical protein